MKAVRIAGVQHHRRAGNQGRVALGGVEPGAKPAQYFGKRGFRIHRECLPQAREPGKLRQTGSQGGIG
jgi:hypothetical protein